EDGIRDDRVTGVQTCALPIYFCEWVAALSRPGKPGQYTATGCWHASAGSRNSGAARRLWCTRSTVSAYPDRYGALCFCTWYYYLHACYQRLAHSPTTPIASPCPVSRS